MADPGTMGMSHMLCCLAQAFRAGLIFRIRLTFSPQRWSTAEPNGGPSCPLEERGEGEGEQSNLPEGIALLSSSLISWSYS
jgi:hypothetical protein